MCKRDLVSIITPLYNADSFIEDMINSVINQTYTNWELIIVDDCSTDQGYANVLNFKDKDKRITLLRNKKNLGPALSRNKGIKHAKGRFIAFLDSDDQWMPDKLEKQIEFMQKNAYTFTFSEYKMIDEADNVIGFKDSLPVKVDYKKLLESNYIGCLTAVYDTRFLGKIYMPEILKRQDYGLWLKILKKIDYAYCLKEPLAIYRIRTSSVSSHKFKLIKYNWKLFRDIEGLSIFQSLYCLSKNVLNKVLK